jgi:hypothetical protein
MQSITFISTLTTGRKNTALHSTACLRQWETPYSLGIGKMSAAYCAGWFTRRPSHSRITGSSQDFPCGSAQICNDPLNSC